MSRRPRLTGICQVEGCERGAYQRRWCKAHYSRWYRGQSFDTPIKERLSEVDRFWSKVDQNGPVPECRPDLGPCWLWTDFLSRGYGQFFANGKTHKAYRYSYELLVGPVPAGLSLDHLCRVTACVRPTHLEPVPIGVNVLRGTSLSAINARKTHCKYGHEFTPENTYVPPKRPNCRHCKTCARQDRVRRDALKREAKAA